MPMTVAVTAGYDAYGNPFVGPVNHTVAIDVDVSGLTTAEVDADGRIKPGVPLTQTGTLVGAAGRVYGVVVEATKVLAGNTSLIGTFQVAVATLCLVNRDVVEDILGRVLSANELAGFADSTGCVLTNT